MSVTFIQPKAVSSSGTPGKLKTQGEIESAICEAMAQIEVAYVGRCPRNIRAHLIGDLLVIRLQCVLTVAEKKVARVLPVAKGLELVKEVRSRLIEVARPKLESLVRDIVGVTLLSLHHDISTRTGEEIVVVTLADKPKFRSNKKK